jgi:hypothetical protein
MSDKPGVVVPEIPPRPKPAMVAAIAGFILSLLALIALHFNIHLCLWLSVATVIATAVTVYLLWKESTTWSGRGTTQTPGIDPHGKRR